MRFRRDRAAAEGGAAAYRPTLDDYNGTRRVQLIVEHLGQD